MRSFDEELKVWDDWFRSGEPGPDYLIVQELQRMAEAFGAQRFVDAYTARYKPNIWQLHYFAQAGLPVDKDVFYAHLDGTEEGDVYYAALGLASMGDSRGSEVLMQFADGSHPLCEHVDGWTDVVPTLVEMVNPNAWHLLEDILLTHHGNVPEHILSLFERHFPVTDAFFLYFWVLAGVAVDREPLCTALSSGDSLDAERAAFALAFLGDDRGFAALEAIIADEEHPSFFGIVGPELPRKLGQMTDPRAQQMLQDIRNETYGDLPKILCGF